MMKNSICPPIQELERIYDYIAHKMELDKISDRPLIVIQSKGRSNTLGWHWHDKWTDENNSVSEITICAEALKENPVETLIHEIVHYHNDKLGINDCNNADYHNKAFKKRAELYGLNVEKMGRHGWASTSLGEELEKELKTLKINYSLFKMYRKPSSKITAPTKMKKWTCGCTVVRCAVELKATCNLCKKEFYEE